MTKNYKILAKYIKDMSSETPDAETYMYVKENISRYQLGINIDSKCCQSGILIWSLNLMPQSGVLIWSLNLMSQSGVNLESQS